MELCAYRSGVGRVELVGDGFFRIAPFARVVCTGDVPHGKRAMYDSKRKRAGDGGLVRDQNRAPESDTQRPSYDRKQREKTHDVTSKVQTARAREVISLRAFPFMQAASLTRRAGVPLRVRQATRMSTDAPT